MFNPQYTITDTLLARIVRINSLITSLNARRFPQVVLMELEKQARAVSSHASTSIEGNPLPLTEVKRILKATPVHLRDSEREVLNYNQALTKLNDQLNQGLVKVTLELILSIQQQVTDQLLPPSQSGKIRKHPVVVNNPLTGQVVFMPPNVEDVKPLLQDLIDFVTTAKGAVDPLIVAGIFHKQMVIIHPFMDGNGRTTRLATKVLLAALGLNTFHLFSFENYYNQNVTKYFQQVGESGDYYEIKDDINFTQWLEYFTEGIIDELLRIEKLLPQVLVSPQTQLQPHHLKLLNHIQDKGFITDKEYSQLTDRAKATRILDFQKLLELGLIQREGRGKGTFYVLKGEGITH